MHLKTNLSQLTCMLLQMHLTKKALHPVASLRNSIVLKHMSVEVRHAKLRAEVYTATVNASLLHTAFM